MVILKYDESFPAKTEQHAGNGGSDPEIAGRLWIYPASFYNYKFPPNLKTIVYRLAQRVSKLSGMPVASGVDTGCAGVRTGRRCESIPARAVSNISEIRFCYIAAVSGSISRNSQSSRNSRITKTCCVWPVSKMRAVARFALLTQDKVFSNGCVQMRVRGVQNGYVGLPSVSDGAVQNEGARCPKWFCCIAVRVGRGCRK